MQKDIIKNYDHLDAFMKDQIANETRKTIKKLIANILMNKILLKVSMELNLNHLKTSDS